MLGRLVPVILAALAVAANAGEAKADLVVSPVVPTTPVRASCLTVAAHANLTLGAGVPEVEISSFGGWYAVFPCYRFVTDISVPTNTSGGPSSGLWEYCHCFAVYGKYVGQNGGFNLQDWVQLSPADCDDYTASVAVYRRLNTLGGSDFDFVGGGSFHGVWKSAGNNVAAHCEAVKDIGFVELSGDFDPPWISTTYRVAVGARIGSSWKQVTAGAWHPVIPG